MASFPVDFGLIPGGKKRIRSENLKKQRLSHFA